MEKIQNFAPKRFMQTRRICYIMPGFVEICKAEVTIWMMRGITQYFAPFSRAPGPILRKIL